MVVGGKGGVVLTRLVRLEVWEDRAGPADLDGDLFDVGCSAVQLGVVLGLRGLQVRALRVLQVVVHVLHGVFHDTHLVSLQGLQGGNTQQKRYFPLWGRGRGTGGRREGLTGSALSGPVVDTPSESEIFPPIHLKYRIPGRTT